MNESRERVQAALVPMSLALPPKRMTVNLSPADLPRDGSHYDLAGMLEWGRISRTRPFRPSHHSASKAALAGGEL